MTPRSDGMHSVKLKDQKEKHLETTPTNFIVVIRQVNAIFFMLQLQTQR